MEQPKDQVDETISTQSDDKGGEAKEDKTQVQDKTYTLADGRKLTGEQVADEYHKLQADYTKKSQELSQIKTSSVNNQTNDQDEQIKSEIKKYGFLTKEEYEELEHKREEKIKNDLIFEQKLENLEKKYDGSDGRPKFSRQEILNYMADPNTRIFDPEKAYEDKYKPDIDKWKITQYLKTRNDPSLLTTERGGSTGTHVPEPKESQSYHKTKKLMESDEEFKRAIVEELKVKEQKI